jgi:hypothetical protein
MQLSVFAWRWERLNGGAVFIMDKGNVGRMLGILTEMESWPAINRYTCMDTVSK